MNKKPILTVCLITTSIIVTLFGICGRKNIYASVKRDILSAPFASSVLVGIHVKIMPWDIFKEVDGIELNNPLEVMSARNNTNANDADSNYSDILRKTSASVSTADPILMPIPTATPTPKPTATTTPTAKPTPTHAPKPTPTPTPTPAYVPRYEPLRATTKEEYLQHVSADIYGTEGVEFAASYDFIQVDELFFDDALFIGDSRTVGLKKYTDLNEHADFLCMTSQNVYKALKSDFGGAGTIEKSITNKKYGKIYVMLGINELGSGTTEDYMKAYTELIDRIIELSPDSKIFVEAIMKVDKEKSESDKVFNNHNIIGRNNALATLADNNRIFYIDVNEAVCDEEGNLDASLTFDHIHLMGKSYDTWKQFLLNHGVRIEEEKVD